jgi:hypothetical protein
MRLAKLLIVGCKIAAGGREALPLDVFRQYRLRQNERADDQRHEQTYVHWLGAPTGLKVLLSN